VPHWLTVILAALLALLISSVMSAIQLVTSQYPNTWFLFTPRKSKAFYAYCILLWGGVGFVTSLLLNTLIANDVVTIKGLNLQSPWVRAVIVGLSAKAFAQLSFYDLTVGTRTVPLGPGLIVQPVQPWLLKQIGQDEGSDLRNFVTDRAAKYPDLQNVRWRIKHAPHDLTGSDRIAFELQIDAALTVEEAMEIHVRVQGRKSFYTAFPP